MTRNEFPVLGLIVTITSDPWDISRTLRELILFKTLAPDWSIHAGPGQQEETRAFLAVWKATPIVSLSLLYSGREDVVHKDHWLQGPEHLE